VVPEEDPGIYQELGEREFGPRYAPEIADIISRTQNTTEDENLNFFDRLLSV